MKTARKSLGAILLGALSPLLLAPAAALTLGNLVWQDTNGNGLQDPGEPGVDGLTVYLWQDEGDGLPGNDPHIATTVTAAGGLYLFTDLAPGSYFVGIDGSAFLPTGPLFGHLSSPGAAEANTDQPLDDNGRDEPTPAYRHTISTLVTLSAGGEPGTGEDGDDTDGNLTVDFGFYPPAQGPILSLGGTVWNDANANGVLDPGETGIADVQIAFFRDGGDGIANSGDDLWVVHAYTDAAGAYRVPALPAGTYFARVEGWNFNPGNALANLFSTPGIANSESNTDDDDNGLDSANPVGEGIYTPWITLAHGDEPDTPADGDDTNGNTTLDFAMIEPPGGANLVVGGGVFLDANGNATRDPGETGIQHVLTVLWIDNGDGVLGPGDSQVNSANTLEDGTYQFPNLPPADYLIVVSRDNFLPSRSLTGRRTSPGTPTDPDDNVAGDDNGAETSAFGQGFHGVITRPVSLRSAAEPTDDGDGDANTNLTVDFGFTEGPAASIGNLVFRDDNNNGQRDPGEPGLPGVYVELWLDDTDDGVVGPGDGSIDQTSTDDTGAYAFTHLAPGRYLVVIRQFNCLPGRALGGLRSSTGNNPAPDPDTDSTDNDDNGSEVAAFDRPMFAVASAPIYIVAGSEPVSEDSDADTNFTVDFGFAPNLPTVSLSIRVFRDANNNGLFEPGLGETGIPDVPIDFHIDNGDGTFGGDEYGTTLATGPDGIAGFNGMPEGDYTLAIPFYGFWPGRAANGLRSSTGNGPAPDPDNDLPGDNNGFESNPGWPHEGVGTHAISLRFGTEPDIAVDGDGPDGNRTLDIALYPGPTLSLTGTVFRDLNNNGIRDATPDEMPIPGVAVELYVDNGDNVLHHGDYGAATTLTDSSGTYHFSGLLAAPYIAAIRLDQSLFGRPLTGLRTSTGNDPAPDPDDDLDSDDNGSAVGAFDDPNWGTASMAVTLAYAAEPDTAVDGDDATGNATVDFGFRPISGMTFVVNSTADPGDGTCDAAECTLREAILAANASPGADTIAFNIAGAGPHTIQPSSELPYAIEPVVLDALTQPGASCTTWPPTLQIELNGSAASGGAGLVFQGGFSVVRGFVINRFNIGIAFSYGAQSRAECNFIGTDVSGSSGFPDASSMTGIQVDSSDNLIGGLTPNLRNLISGGHIGIYLNQPSCSNNVAQGNYVGTTATGNAPIPHNYVGILLGNARHNHVRDNLVSGNQNVGIFLNGPDSAANLITGNRIGTTADGTTALPNQNSGLLLNSGAHDNTIGGSGPGDGNLISGNNWTGIEFQNTGTSGNLVLGNLIGTDVTGTLPLGNHAGIQFYDGTDGNQVGSPDPGARNVISGNRTDGILVNNAGPVANRILGNWIGLAANGSTPLPNQSSGVGIVEGTSAAWTVIGGTAPGEGNVIAHNLLWGVFATDDGPSVTSVRGNAIHHNQNLGIDLLPTPGSPSGPTPNDPLDADSGANGLQNFPDLVIASATPTATVFDGVLSSSPSQTFALDFFVSPDCDNSGFGEGQSYIGSAEVTTDASGVAYFVVSLPTTSLAGQFATATATATGAGGRTSEFSACRTIVDEGGPALVSASTGGALNRIELTFSESVDPTSATALANYDLEPGATVLNAALGDNPRTVILETSPMPVGTAFVLTVNGVTDRATPPHAITADSQIGILQTLGHLTRREYRSIPGSTVADLLAHPRFPQQPSVVDYPTLAESPSDLGNFHGVQLLGYLHPDTTGNHVFYLAADDRAELWLSTDDNPAHKLLIATESQPNSPRQWTGGSRPVTSTFPAGTRFIEAEDFDHAAGQWLSGTPIGMDGSYPGGSYSGLGSAADANIDWHEENPGNDSPSYRASTAVETREPTDTLSASRAGFNVSSRWIVGWNDVGDWRNYTRDFGAPQEYRVYARIASGGSDIQTRLDEVTAGVGTVAQTTVQLGSFNAQTTGDWNSYTVVPLQDGSGAPVVLTLGGLRTLRFTHAGGNGDPDYLAFVPTSGPSVVLRTSNVSDPVHLVAGQRYYIEALHKETAGPDALAVAWQPPGAPTPANGSSPIPGAFLEAIVDPSLLITPPPSMSLGNLVFNDTNNNGVFEPGLGETGINNVSVQLYRDDDANNWLDPAIDTLLATTTTSGGGLYRFDGLLTDTYLVAIPPANFAPGGPLAFRPNSDFNGWANWDTDNDDDGVPRGEQLGIVSSGDVWLEDGREPTNDGDSSPWTNLTIDFGFRPAAAPGAIGNIVFLDANRDGLFNAADGDAGIEGVVVDLFRDDGDLQRDAGDGPAIATTTTSASGLYTFSDLGPGDYHVEIDPANFIAGGALAAHFPTPTASGNPNDDVDADSNGITVPGQTVMAHLVRLETGTEPVSDDGEPNTNLTIDFGFVPATGLSLGDLVWLDTNANGQFDAGETGIPNVLIHLVRDDGDGTYYEWESVIAETRTDALGRFRFTSLEPGTYFAVVQELNFHPDQPLHGLASSPGAASADTNADNDDNGADRIVPVRRGIPSTGVTLAAGTEPADDGDGADGNLTVDFGFVAPAQPNTLVMGGILFVDTNANGLRDDGEPPIPNVGVSLYRDDGDGVRENNGEDTDVYGTGTDENGAYRFTGLPPGGYWALIHGGYFHQPHPLYGLLSTPGAADANLDLPGDDNGVDELVPTRQGIWSTLVTLAHATEPDAPVDGDDTNGNRTVDFAFHAPANPPVLTLGGSLFHDVNANGLRDPGESGITGLYVMVFRDDGDGTFEPYADDIQANDGGLDANGHWELTALTPGGYWVFVPNWNFNEGNPLHGKASSPGVALPDSNVPGDDNGIDAPTINNHVQAHLITLANGTEPDTAVDGDGPDSNQTLDFGFVDLPAGGPNLRLGGSVFADTNNNGQLDAGETGPDNVYVEAWLDDGSGTLDTGDLHAGAAYTSGGGRYEFQGLVPGDYLVAVPRNNFLPGSPLNGTASSTGNDPAPDPDDDLAGDDNGTDLPAFGQLLYGSVSAPVSLRQDSEPTTEDGDNKSNLTVDFGFQPNGGLAVGGSIFRDDNANGSYNPGSGEAGIPAVWVEIWIDQNADGIASEGDWHLASTESNAEGRYAFTVPPGDYLAFIRYHQFLTGRPLNGLRSSGTLAPPTDPDDDIASDNNGLEVAGWNRPFIGTGTHPLRVTPGDEPDTGVDGDGTHSNRTLDLGFLPGPTLSIGDRVFIDTNGNSTYDATDTGIAGVHVKLFYDVNGDGTLGETDDDMGVDIYSLADGTYQLGGLPEGDYLVVLPFDNGWPGRPLNGLRTLGDAAPAPDPDLVPADHDDNGEERSFPSWGSTLQISSRALSLRHATGSTPALDFGFSATGSTASLAGTVFRDNNNNGTLDPGETGVPGVIVQLFQDNGDGILHHGDWQAAEATTDATGLYTFAGLLPGDYSAVIRLNNHFRGGPLTGLRTSTGNDPAPDPDNNLPGDDNGTAINAFDDPAFGVASLPLTLTLGSEPDTAVDGDDTHGNRTLDLGFHPVTGTTLVVTSVEDTDDGACDAHCTLREAIRAANDNPGRDTITFAIPGAGVLTLQPGSRLPDIIEPVDLDATTQPGYAGSPLIEINGANAGPDTPGLVVQGGDSRIRGLIINRFTAGGIHINSGDHNVIQGNFIGTDASGTVALGNGTPGHGGINIAGSNDHLIGGTEAAARNLVSGNDIGISAQPTERTLIQGNFVGTDITGTLAVGNSSHYGIIVSGRDNLIGGSAPGAGNLVSGNNAALDPWNGWGIYLNGDGPGNRIEGNLVGTDITGTLPIPNHGGIAAWGPGTRIGGTDPGAGNLASGNNGAGISAGTGTIVEGNIVGLNRTGTAPLGNAGAGVGVAENTRIGGPTAASRNIISANRDDGIVLCGGQPGGNLIEGNFIGTDITGTIGLGNGTGGWGPGIRTCVQSISNVIRGNLVAHNRGDQVDLRSSGNVVQGNTLGTDVTGTLALSPFSGGIGLYETAVDNLIGGADPGTGNLIAGNTSNGIYLAGSGVTGTRILGNRIGTDVTGTLPVPNGAGIAINDSPGHQVGGIAAGEGNLIAFNQGSGVSVNGGASLNVSIRGNSIHSNGSAGPDIPGIDLIFGASVTPNDPGDSDDGPNHVQNYPDLTSASASASNLYLEGVLDSTPNTSFTLDFYTSPACSGSGYGEGRTWIATRTFTTGLSGPAGFSFNLGVAVNVGEVVTATATDPAGNTSEFSHCTPIQPEGPPTLVSATTGGQPDRIVLRFSESLDPALANDPARYSIPGVNVISATLGGDRRTVTLVTSLLPAGTLTVGYAGLADLADPPNVVAGGTTGTILNTQGVITRSAWIKLPGGRIVDLTGTPAFLSDPYLIDHLPAFEAPANVTDNFGQRLSGYITAPVTGDYVFRIASDDASELWLSPDTNPAGKVRLAGVTYWLWDPRGWNAGPVNVPASSVLGASTLFVEAEDFDHGNRQWVTDQPIGMTGPYPGGAYANLGSAADQGTDFSESTDAAAAQYYRIETGVEIFPVTDSVDHPYGHLNRGTFAVTQAWKLGYNGPDEWWNYTREFPAPAQDYWVFARMASNGDPIAARLDTLTFDGGPGPGPASTNKLGDFHSPRSAGWDNFVFIPLTDDLGQPVRVGLGGLQTLRLSVIPGSFDFDYLAFVPAPAGAEPPTYRPENVSPPVHLVAGEQYYIEALGKEGSGADFLAVSWQLPGDPAPINGDPPIPGQFLSSLAPSGPISVAQEPQDQSGNERAPVTFSVEVQGTPPYHYQWLRNDSPIPGATRHRLDLAMISIADDGARFRVSISNNFSQALSREAILHVTPDTTPPTLLSAAGSPGLDQVILRFSEPVSAATAGNPAFYTLSDDLAVLVVELRSGGTQAILTTTTQAPEKRYGLALGAIQDTAAAPNTLAPDTRTRFVSWRIAPGIAVHRYWANIGNGPAALRADSRFPDQPTRHEHLTAAEYPPDAATEGGRLYGDQVFGWLVPPVSGLYRFYVNSDDPSELYLSTDERPANKVLIASEPVWNNPRQWRATDRRNPDAPENASALIPLVAGQRYWFETLHTEGDGGDNIGVTWQLPGAPEVANDDPPIQAAHLQGSIDAAPHVPTLTTLSPTFAAQGGGAITLLIDGANFETDAVVLWNGIPRTTTVVGPTQVSAEIPASDLAGDIPVGGVQVSVRNTIGPASDPLAFTLVGALVEEAESAIATIGESATTSTAPTTDGATGVTAMVENQGNSDPIIVTSATYTENPGTESPAFEIAGAYVDVQVLGAEPADVASTQFYYPNTVTGEAESDLDLLFWNGTDWTFVLGSGGVLPTKNTTDNLDGTVSGGRFTVILDDTSTPKLTELTGEIFTFSPIPPRAPVAVTDTLTTKPGLSAKLTVRQILANDSDEDFEPLTLVSAGPASLHGGLVTLREGWIFYTPAPGFTGPDSIPYIVTDGTTAPVAGTIQVVIASPGDGQGRNLIRVEVGPDSATVRFAGIPGRTYAIEATPDLGTPVWTRLGSVTANNLGELSWIDFDYGTFPQRFYRTVEP